MGYIVGMLNHIGKMPKTHYKLDFCNSFKIQDFIRHIHNYTEYNQQWNVSQVCSMDSAIICNKHKRIYINIGMKKMK